LKSKTQKPPSGQKCPSEAGELTSPENLISHGFIHKIGIMLLGLELREN
jgi:hypothetical protein